MLYEVITRMLRLTPFRNDALTDVPGDGVIVRNDRTGKAFSVAVITSYSIHYTKLYDNKPALIPKMALKGGITDDCTTMVVIPALVISEEDGRELLGKMEVYWAANQQSNLYFTLLSDFKEDKNEIAAQDEQIIESMERIVSRLNEQYGRALFFYAQRKRTLIKENGRYGGYERKRGALLDFCHMLDGDASAFLHVTKGRNNFV